MISPADIPINSISWLFGALACFALGIKSLLAYRKSYNLLTKYIAWFGMIMGTALLFFSVPTFFLLDTEQLRPAWVIGEFLVYSSLVVQAMILWALTLRTKVSVYLPAIAAGIVGFASWANAAPHLTLYLDTNFIGYNEPRLSTLGMALLFSVLFIPVGFHFMKATLRQNEFKARLMTFVLGMVYVGTGVSTASHLIAIGQVASITSSLGNLGFFLILLGATAWPRRAKIKTPAIAVYGRTSQ
jgi:hypothetical protein